MVREDPPPTGYLLAELGYLDEPEAAAALDITPQTLVAYRKARSGPEFIEVARRIMYSRESLARWLAKGGTRKHDDVR